MGIGRTGDEARSIRARIASRIAYKFLEEPVTSLLSSTRDEGCEAVKLERKTHLEALDCHSTREEIKRQLEGARMCIRNFLIDKLSHKLELVVFRPGLSARVAEER